MGITIRQFNSADWEAYAIIRLQALKADPEVLGSTWEREAAHPSERWQAGVSDPDVAIFGVYDDGILIGMTGVAIERGDSTKTKAHLWGSWLRNDYRGKGISKLMYQVRIAWARAHPTCLVLNNAHRSTNAASKAANQKYGFIYTHEVMRHWPDGKDEPEIFYSLPVKS